MAPPPAALVEAAALARAQAIAPDTALVATGAVSENFYYQSLAHHLGVSFIDGDAQLGIGVRYPHSILAGVAPLASDGPRWLVAPREETLASLLRRRRRGEVMHHTLAIATPSHLSCLVRAAAAPAIARDASFALANLDPDLSAKAGATSDQRRAAALAIAAAGLVCALTPAFAQMALTISTSFLFLAAICLRLFAGAASAERSPIGPLKRLDDRLLPPYSIIVALHREARVVSELIAALESLDYPRGKLDIKLVLEEDDHATRLALEAVDLPAPYEIIVAPPGWPRTKPRALNIALGLVRGEYVAVFDAEDVPAPRQLRDAAERFLCEPRGVACLQAQLSIDNVDDSWLTRLFTIEYAILFDVMHHGMADLGMPLALGGSSNHFRAETLREVCAWDAWNVTEDADLGLRLARFGYKSKTLGSTTQEEAPARLRSWMKQRRRWSKGWTQTFITLSRDPGRLVSQVGWSGLATFSLMMVNMVFAPLLWPILTGLMVYLLWTAGLPEPNSVLSVIETTLWLSVATFGPGSVIWLALLGMKRRKLFGLWPFLPLLLPYYLLMSAAAWAAIYDLVSRPFHWHKTEHGLARRSRHKERAHSVRTASALVAAVSGRSGIHKLNGRTEKSAPALSSRKLPAKQRPSKKASNSGGFAAQPRDQTCPPLVPSESASAELFRAFR